MLNLLETESDLGNALSPSKSRSSEIVRGEQDHPSHLN
jgi:hypothetical protein